MTAGHCFQHRFWYHSGHGLQHRVTAVKLDNKRVVLVDVTEEVVPPRVVIVKVAEELALPRVVIVDVKNEVIPGRIVVRQP